jgi:hypothetical protein
MKLNDSKIQKHYGQRAMARVKVLNEQLFYERRLRKADLVVAMEAISNFKSMLDRDEDDMDTVFALVTAVLDPFAEICGMKIERIGPCDENTGKVEKTLDKIRGTIDYKRVKRTSLGVK